MSVYRTIGPLVFLFSPINNWHSGRVLDSIRFDPCEVHGKEQILYTDTNNTSQPTWSILSR